MLDLRNFTIRARLFALAGLAMAAMLLVGGHGLWALSEARAHMRHYVGNEVEALSELAGVRAGVGNLRRYEKDTLINLADAKAVAKYRKEWGETYEKVRAGLEALAKLEAGPSLSDTVGRMRAALDTYRSGFSGIAERVANGEFSDTASANKAMEPLKAPVREMDKVLGDLTKLIDERSVGQVAHMDSHAEQVRFSLSTVIVVGVVALGIFTVFTLRSILNPLQSMQRDSARIAEHDLSVPIKVDGRDETTQLLAGLGKMQDALINVVSGVRGATDSISTASREVAAGAMDLSQRTEQAAANLQRTASAMDELTGSVRHSADSARQANELARDAAGVAQQGGQVVGDVVSTMERISASSRKIGDIISVIDGIAFQTNILALNAAVEAARAGEQGRGFAVVASEVRSLAGRSAEAAKEIKSLITASTESVQSGSEQVARAGETMKGIMASIERVSSIVGEIRHAADEQNAGIQQVGQAISELDQMTQQNAALVEESAAAASSLRQQALELSRAVGVFKLG